MEHSVPAVSLRAGVWDAANCGIDDAVNVSLDSNNDAMTAFLIKIAGDESNTIHLSNDEGNYRENVTVLASAPTGKG